MRKTLLAGAVTALALFPLAAPSWGAEAKLMFAAGAYLDKDARGLKGPEGVACASDALVIAADTGNGRLLRYSFDGEQFKGGEEIRLPEGTYPTRVQVDSKGKILCFDARKRRVLRIGADGGSPETVEFSGVPGPDLALLRSFRVDREDKLYLLDPANGRVVVTDPTGAFLRAVALPSDTGSVDDLAVDARGAVYVLDGVRGALYGANSGAPGFTVVTARLKEYLNVSTDFEVDGRGRFYLTDQAGGGIVYLGPDGTFLARYSSLGWRDGLLRHPAQLCVDKNQGFVVAADRDNNRVQLFAIR